MSNYLKYKGYYTKVTFSNSKNTLIGKIDGINDLVSFNGKSIDEFKQKFFNAVDDYLKYCEEKGKIPVKAYNGIFNVRVSSDIHRKLSVLALKKGISMNEIAKISFIYIVKNPDLI